MKKKDVETARTLSARMGSGERQDNETGRRANVRRRNVVFFVGFFGPRSPHDVSGDGSICGLWRTNLKEGNVWSLVVRISGEKILSKKVVSRNDLIILIKISCLLTVEGRCLFFNRFECTTIYFVHQTLLYEFTKYLFFIYFLFFARQEWRQLLRSPPGSSFSTQPGASFPEGMPSRFGHPMGSPGSRISWG